MGTGAQLQLPLPPTWKFGARTGGAYPINDAGVREGFSGWENGERQLSLLLFGERWAGDLAPML